MHFCTSHDSHLTALDAFKLGWVMVGMGLIGGITRKLWIVRSTILRNYFQVKENMVAVGKISKVIFAFLEGTFIVVVKKTFRCSTVFFYNHLCRNSVIRNIIMKSG